jgi:hypothetical protein
MIPTIRDPNAIRIDTTPIGTEDLSKASTFFECVGANDEVGVEVGTEDSAGTELCKAVVEFWPTCDI